jgi:1,4-alpha-glucan branching enzyme
MEKEKQVTVITQQFEFLAPFDLHLLGEGIHYRLYEKLGAQLTSRDGVQGRHFA